MLLLQVLQSSLTATAVSKQLVDAGQRAIKDVVVLVVSGAVDTPLELLPGQKVDAAQLGCGILQGVCLADNHQTGMWVACFCSLLILFSCFLCSLSCLDRTSAMRPYCACVCLPVAVFSLVRLRC